MTPRTFRAATTTLSFALLVCTVLAGQERSRIGQEVAIVNHLKDGDERALPIAALIERGRQLFSANWTDQDGAGRPLSKGNGEPLADRSQPLQGARAVNRVSGPDANSCQGCHNSPFGITGGRGDFVTSGIELAERFDFVTFDKQIPGAGSLTTVGNLRATPGLFGAGYIEMLARQITADLQRTRDAILPGQSKRLSSQGIAFGTLARRADGTWNTQAVEGLPAQSLQPASAAAGKPTLVIHPWRHSATVVSLRDMTNTFFNQHLGIQTSERFGVDKDPDGDGIVNEVTRADVTAVTMFQATLPVPGRLVPNDPDIERAIANGERAFAEVRCTTCHVPALRLNRPEWKFTERGAVADLVAPSLPQPRLAASPDEPGVVVVPLYTDFKLHDITDPADASAAEPLDMNQPLNSPRLTAGNRKFLTKRLWGAGNQPPYFHHGLFTTMRQAVLAHAGEALEQRRAFERLAKYDQDSLIEFLKSLQVLPPASRTLVVDERGQPKVWPRPILSQ